MELKEYLKIIKKNGKIFFGTIALVVVSAFSCFYLASPAWDTSLTLNISRSGIQKTDQYRYDDFYRIQADEKFAETIVQWLQSPVIVDNIYKKAEIDTRDLSLRQLKKAISADKLSPQVVSVSFSSASPQSGEKIAAAVSSVVSENIQKLNKDQQEDNWFEIISERPITIKYAPNPGLVFFGAVFFGIFLGFILALIKHYME